MTYTPMFRQLDADQRELFDQYYEKTLGAQDIDSLIRAKDQVYSDNPEAKYEIWLDYLHKAAVKHFSELSEEADPEALSLTMPRNAVMGYLDHVQHLYLGEDGDTPDASRVPDIDEPHLAWLEVMAEDAKAMADQDASVNHRVAARYMLDTEGMEMSFDQYKSLRETCLIDVEDTGQYIPMRSYLEWYERCANDFVDGMPSEDLAKELKSTVKSMGSEAVSNDKLTLYSIYKKHDIHPAFESATRSLVEDYLRAEQEKQNAPAPGASMSFG